MPGIARLARIAFNYSARMICLRVLDQKLIFARLTQLKVMYDSGNLARLFEHPLSLPLIDTIRGGRERGT